MEVNNQLDAIFSAPVESPTKQLQKKQKQSVTLEMQTLDLKSEKPNFETSKTEVPAKDAVKQPQKSEDSVPKEQKEEQVEAHDPSAMKRIKILLQPVYSKYKQDEVIIFSHKPVHQIKC